MNRLPITVDFVIANVEELVTLFEDHWPPDDQVEVWFTDGRKASFDGDDATRLRAFVRTLPRWGQLN